MVRLTASLALAAVLATLAACGSPEKAAEPEAAAAAAPDVATAEQTPVMPVDAPPQEEAEGEHLGAADRTCTDSIGAAAATRLAERCTMVSPATHPPCNPDNACDLIQDEIDRACGMYGPGETRPAECAA